MPFLRFIFGRVIAILVTLLIITALLYGVVMLTPPETRATLYLPERLPSNLTEEGYQRLINNIIKKYHLNEPYPIQYYFWLNNLVQGDWGYSPIFNEGIFPALIKRTPATLELTIYSLVFFIPLGLIAGLSAGWKKGQRTDRWFRTAAFISTSMPPFILAFILIAIFYVNLYWFPPERLSLQYSLIVRSEAFKLYTGLYTIDSLLNGRLDIFQDSVRHLVLPVITLSLVHWATLGRVTRATVIEEKQKEYVIAARARGVPESRLAWRHTFRNAFAPSIASSLLSAAALITGVFVVEIIYNIHGVSELAVNSMRTIPDAPAALGFAIYSVLVVMFVMFILDLLQIIVDPRFRSKGRQ